MDDLSPGARALLRAADSHDDPSAEDALRVRRAVLAQVGAIGVGAALVTAGTTQAKAASVASIAAKLTAVVALTASGVGVWSYATHSNHVVQAPPLPAAAAPLRDPQRRLSQPPAAEPQAASDETALEAPAKAPVVAKGQRISRTAEPSSAVGKPAPSEPAKAAPAQVALESEMKLLRAADGALRAGNTSGALSLLAQHQAEHPQAALAHEREGLRAIVQCQVGAPGSRAAAERFVQASPRSTMAARLRGACKIGD